MLLRVLPNSDFTMAPRYILGRLDDCIDLMQGAPCDAARTSTFWPPFEPTVNPTNKPTGNTLMNRLKRLSQFLEWIQN
jgi:hypothetical protein